MIITQGRFMSKTGGFEVYSAESSDSSGGSNIDFDALNKYVVETAELQNGETLVGYVSNIVDLGTQKLPDAEYNVDKGDEDLTIGELTDKYQDKIDSGDITKFELSWDNDVKAQVIKKFVPQKDRQAICYSVDIPEIMLDKAPFFGGESDPKPLRLWAGGEWWDKDNKQMVISSLIALKKTKDDKLGWTMHPRSQLYRMATAGKVITTQEAFQPEMLDQLLGKSLQFKAQIFFNKGKNGGEYYTEKLNFVGGLARGQQEIEDVNTNLIMFNAENDETALKEIRKHVINTMSKAVNFEGSAIQKQLIAIGKYTPKPVESTASSKVEAANNSAVDDTGFGF